MAADGRGGRERSWLSLGRQRPGGRWLWVVDFEVVARGGGDEHHVLQREHTPLAVTPNGQARRPGARRGSRYAHPESAA